MYCLTNMCYVCLKTKKNLKNINNSYSYDEKLLRIIDCFAFDLSWLRNKSIILICEECCAKLRETYQFLEMCHQNSAVLQGYISHLDNSPISDNYNEAKLLVMLDDINSTNPTKLGIKEEHDNCVHNIEGEQDTLIELCDIKAEISCANETINEEIAYANETINEEVPFTNGTINEEQNDILMEYCDIKKEITNENEVSNVEVESEISHVKREKTHSKILPNDHNDSNHNDGGSSQESCKQVHAPSKRKIIKPEEKIYQCSICAKCFAKPAYVYKHMIIHGKKPYQCSTCQKRFATKYNLRKHVLIHTE